MRIAPCIYHHVGSNMVIDPWTYYHVASNMTIDPRIYYHVASNMTMDPRSAEQLLPHPLVHLNTHQSTIIAYPA